MQGDSLCSAGGLVSMLPKLHSTIDSDTYFRYQINLSHAPECVNFLSRYPRKIDFFLQPVRAIIECAIGVHSTNS